MSIVISFLVSVLVIALVFYLVSLLPIERRMKRILWIGVAIVGALSLLRYVAIL